MSGPVSGPTSLRSPEPVPVSALPGNDPGYGRALLAKVLDYYEGRKPYDFHRLSDYQRGIQSFDAWQEIAGEIRTFLGRDKRKRRNKAKEATNERAE